MTLASEGVASPAGGLTNGRPSADFAFISYARHDSNFVSRLTADLAERGITCWVDRSGLKPGTPDWEQAIRDAIRSCRGVILVASPNSRQSAYVGGEIELADMYARQIYPIWATGDVWPDCVRLGRTFMQYVDARGDRYQGAVDELVEQLDSSFPPLASAQPEPEFEPRNPYKGLSAFHFTDAADFFGRDKEVDHLIETLGRVLTPSDEACARLLAVVGPSGSGKSSTTMAGLLPALVRGRLPGSEQWIYLGMQPDADRRRGVVPMVPGEHPLEALTLTLASRLPARSHKTISEDLEDESCRGLHRLASALLDRPDQRVVLVVDQFEELFSPAIDEQERQRMIDLLVAAVTDSRGPLAVILTLRADLYHHVMAYPDLWRIIEQRTCHITRMSVDELRAVIEEPARLRDTRLTFEGDLIGDMLFEVRDQEAALPLLEFTLDRLFRERHGHRLTVAAYKEIGGVTGALGKHADEVFQRLPSDEHRRLARELFRRLIDTRLNEDKPQRRRLLGGLVLGAAHETTMVQEVAEAFVDGRLLTAGMYAGEKTLEISHEALIQTWQQLRTWSREDREGQRIATELEHAAKQWAEYKRDKSALYKGLLLDEARQWRASRGPALSHLELEFLAASEQAEEREAHDKARRTRIIRIGAGLAGLFVLLFAIGATWQWREADLLRVQAQQASRDALSREMAALAAGNLLENQLDLASLLAVAASRRLNNDGAVTNGLLFTTAVANPSLVRYLRGHSQAVRAVSFHPDGVRLASAGEDGTIRLWDVGPDEQIGEPISVAGHTPIDSLAFNANGSMLAAGTADGRVLLFDADSRSAILSALPVRGGAAGNVWSVAFSPSPSPPVLVAGTDSGLVTAWNPDTGVPIALRVPPDSSGSVRSVSFSPDGRTLGIAADEGVKLVDVATGQVRPLELGTLTDNSPRGGSSVAFSDDSKTVAVGTFDGMIQIWDVRSGQPVRDNPLAPGHYAPGYGPVSSLAFNRNGKMLAAGTLEGLVTLWDPSNGHQLGSPLRGKASTAIYSLAFSSQDDTLITGDSSGDVVHWSPTGTSRVGLYSDFALQGGVVGLAFSPDARKFATAAYGDTGGVAQRSAATGKPTSGDALSTQPSRAVAYSPDGQTLAAAVLDGIELWDARSGQPKGLTLHDGPPNVEIESLAWMDTTTLAAGSHDGTIRVWSTDSGRVAQKWHADDGAVVNLAYSPNRATLASVTPGNGVVHLWNSAGRSVGDLQSGFDTRLWSVAYNSSGTLVAAGTTSGSIWLWDVASPKPGERRAPDGEPLLGHTGVAWSLAFSPDNAVLASGGADGTLRLWDIASRRPLGAPIQGKRWNNRDPSGVTSVAFRADGNVLVSGSDNGAVTLWHLDPDSWRSADCSRANLHLTPQDWSRFFPDETPDPCPGTQYRQADTRARHGDSNTARLLFEQATREAAAGGNAGTNNGICWDGTVDGFANVVMPDCDRAVALGDIGRGVWHGDYYRDSRALARALVGDTSGALDDYQKFLSWARGNYASDQCVTERERFVNELRAGESPTVVFNASTLHDLQDEDCP